MKIITGDIVKQALEFDIIVHGCNCFNNMGGGLAKQIKRTFPEAYKVDCQTKRGDKKKLGNFTACVIKLNNSEITIINAYTQFYYKIISENKKKLVDYNALRNVFKQIKKHYNGKKIAYPLIGAGLAGGNWEIISKIIDEELINEDHTLVKYSKN